MWGRLRGDSAARFERARTFGSVHAQLRGPAEHTVLDLSGELDFAVPDQLEEWVLSLPHRIVAIDLERLEFVDAHGVVRLRALAHQCGAAAHLDEPATLLQPPAEIERAFDLVERLELRQR